MLGRALVGRAPRSRSPLAAAADTLRVATYDVGLSRDGPGLLLHDLGRRPSRDAGRRAAVIRAVAAGRAAPHRLRPRPARPGARRLPRAARAQGPDGIDYPHAFDAPVNAGEPSGHDLDGDGRTMGWGDAFGWGKFPGNGGMAILSRLPIDADGARGASGCCAGPTLPGARAAAAADGSAVPRRRRRRRRSGCRRASHWDVPVLLPDGGRLHLLAAEPDAAALRRRRGLQPPAQPRRDPASGPPTSTAPRFRDDAGRDGGAARRAAGACSATSTSIPLDGAGAARRRSPALLAHPRLQDPRPASAGGAAAGRDGVNGGHDGDPALDTADWRDDGGPGQPAGRLRAALGRARGDRRRRLLAGARRAAGRGGGRRPRRTGWSGSTSRCRDRAGRRLTPGEQLANFMVMKRHHARCGGAPLAEAPHRGQLAPDRRVRLPRFRGEALSITTHDRPSGARGSFACAVGDRTTIHGGNHDHHTRPARDRHPGHRRGAPRPRSPTSCSTARPELGEELLAELARARIASGDGAAGRHRADGLDADLRGRRPAPAR